MQINQSINHTVPSDQWHSYCVPQYPGVPQAHLCCSVTANSNFFCFPPSLCALVGL